MDGIVIDNVTYKLVKDPEDFGCADCALEKYCNGFTTSICTAAFTLKDHHFEKIEETSIKNKEQSETLNQTYFY